MKKLNIFLSYCWSDEEIANQIFTHFKNVKNIELHKDVIDIKEWCSIREYMYSISSMDYTILLISDAYLKSANCMYEVLEVMRDRKYRDKIFPAIINSGIYRPAVRARYVKYWEDQFKELDAELKKISVQNLGKLNKELKSYQDISSNIAEFLDIVSDMNNPNIEDVSERIEKRLYSNGFSKIQQKSIRSTGDVTVQKFVTEFNIKQIPLFETEKCAKKEIYILGNTLNSLYNEIHNLEDMLTRGIEVKLLAMDILDKENYEKNCNYLGADIKRMTLNSIMAFDRLSTLFEKYSRDKLEIRVSKLPVYVGIVAVDTTEDTGMIVATHLLRGCLTHECLISKICNDSVFYDRYKTHLKECWEKNTKKVNMDYINSVDKLQYNCSD